MKVAAKGIEIGVAEAIGMRPYMEDRHKVAELVVETVTEDEGGERTVTRKSLRYFGVFDGHGGPFTSTFCHENLHQVLQRRPELHKGDLHGALTNAFEELDAQLTNELTKETFEDGSTAVVAVFDESSQTIWVANAGDSRAVLGLPGEKVFPMSEDHKPSRPDESKRVISAGGLVEQTTFFNIRMGPMRVYTSERTGGLAVSRSFGDTSLKKPNLLVLPTPDIQTYQWSASDEFDLGVITPPSYATVASLGLSGQGNDGIDSQSPLSGDSISSSQSSSSSSGSNGGDGVSGVDDPQELTSTPPLEENDLSVRPDFLLMATDGLWDVFTNESAVRVVSKHRQLGHSAKAIAETLIQSAISRRSGDNITVVVVFFHTLQPASQVELSSSSSSSSKNDIQDSSVPTSDPSSSSPISDPSPSPSSSSPIQDDDDSTTHQE